MNENYIITILNCFNNIYLIQARIYTGFDIDIDS